MGTQIYNTNKSKPVIIKVIGMRENLFDIINYYINETIKKYNWNGLLPSITAKLKNSIGPPGRNNMPIPISILKNKMINQGNKSLGFSFLKAVTSSKIVETILTTSKMIAIIKIT